VVMSRRRPVRGRDSVAAAPGSLMRSPKIRLCNLQAMLSLMTVLLAACTRNAPPDAVAPDGGANRAVTNYTITVQEPASGDILPSAMYHMGTARGTMSVDPRSSWNGAKDVVINPSLVTLQRPLTTDSDVELTVPDTVRSVSIKAERPGEDMEAIRLPRPGWLGISGRGLDLDPLVASAVVTAGGPRCPGSA
jgi:hypothetical protein